MKKQRVYFFILKMEAVFVSETLVPIYETTLCYNSKYRQGSLNRLEHLKAY
jgi:hypothetical protein